MPAPPDALRAALAGRYEVDREIGRGGMATVYLARDLRHHRQVAIKIIRPELATALGTERFLREIDTAASLTHPNILPLHDSGEAGGFLYFVMPYVEGESLRTMLARESQLPLDAALQIAREVADALAYAHAHGIVHRDIKPANILLESGHAVVADFGIARAVSAAAGETITETGMTLGTPAYMSPEQAAGSKTLDGRSDLYSLGCVLYEMLAGQPPFTGPTGESLVRQHLSAAPRPVTDLRPTVPVWVAGALQHALAKAPADRPSAAALGAALAHHDSDSGTAAPASWGLPAAGGQPTGARRAPVSRRTWVLGMAGVLAVAVVAAAMLAWRPWAATAPPAPPAHPRTAVAVLPFQNLSADAANAYFAGGLHDELLTQLSKVASLKVISRTSVMGYQGTAKALTQIGDELKVGTIVEGSVQVVGDRLRVNAQLIDAATDQHLWAERYDRTLDDAFAIQSDLAQKIVAAVGAALSSEEQRSLAKGPTGNAEAYRLYLKGLEYWKRPGYLRENMEKAQEYYETSLALDPEFARGYAALSVAHGQIGWFRYDTSPARFDAQRRAAERALQLAPDMPEAHLAMGRVHYQRRDWKNALDEYGIALKGLPSDGVLWGWLGYTHRRMGDWNQAFNAYAKATDLDPRDANLHFDLGGCTFQLTRRYTDARRSLDRAIELAPDLYQAMVVREWTQVLSTGDLAALQQTLSTMPPREEFGGERVSVPYQRCTLFLLSRDARGLLREARRDPEKVFAGQVSVVPAALFAGWGYQLARDRASSRAAFESARARLEPMVHDLPDDWRVHAAFGLSLAGLGRRIEARREAEWLRTSAAYARDAYDGPMVAEDRARILAQVGDTDEALDEIERLLTRPSWLSTHTLRLDPRWDPIRNHPRFKALLERYGP